MILFSPCRTFSKYYLANTVAYEAYSASVCDADCRRYHYCAMAKQDYGTFNDCIAEHFGYDTTTTDTDDDTTTTDTDDTDTTTSSAGRIICNSYVAILLFFIQCCRSL